MLDGTLWPGRPKPLDGESFSSWIARIAIANGLAPQTLLRALFPDGPRIDLRWHDKAHQVKAVAAATSTPIGRLRRLTLADELRVLGVCDTQAIQNFWIASSTSGTRTLPPQVCIECIDTLGYFRKEWYFAFVTRCQVHGGVLKSRKPIDDDVFFAIMGLQKSKGCVSPPPVPEHLPRLSRFLLSVTYQEVQLRHLNARRLFLGLRHLILKLFSVPHGFGNEGIPSRPMGESIPAQVNRCDASVREEIFGSVEFLFNLNDGAFINLCVAIGVALERNRNRVSVRNLLKELNDWTYSVSHVNARGVRVIAGDAVDEVYRVVQAVRSLTRVREQANVA